MKFSSVNEILDYAMDKEEDAAQFYTSLADKMDKEYTFSSVSPRKKKVTRLKFRRSKTASRCLRPRAK